MSDEIKASGITNPEPGTVVGVKANCSVLWGAAHQFAYVRLSEGMEDENATEVDLLDCYYTRARRIAATYARFYLEDEQGCDKAKKGRFYWMALGAFASKTVASLLDSWQIKRSFDMGTKETAVISEGLGLGNLWLFMDISVWHWAYANMPQHYFKGMECEKKRDAQKLPKEGVFETVTENLEWAGYALDKINDLKPTDYMTEGMKLAEEIEEMGANDKGKPVEQFKHLVAIANHEQLKILQPLIYNHEGFADILKLERTIKQGLDQGIAYFKRKSMVKELAVALLARKALIDYELVFSAGCATEDEALKSVAPDGMKLEEAGTLEDAKEDNPKTRMGWIGKAAGQFHGLMQGTKDTSTIKYMEGELQKMAGWVNEPDFGDCVSVAKISGAFK